MAQIFGNFVILPLGRDKTPSRENFFNASFQEFVKTNVSSCHVYLGNRYYKFSRMETDRYPCIRNENDVKMSEKTVDVHCHPSVTI